MKGNILTKETVSLILAPFFKKNEIEAELYCPANEKQETIMLIYARGRKGPVIFKMCQNLDLYCQMHNNKNNWKEIDYNNFGEEKHD